jgi:hypothetical protein
MGVLISFGLIVVACDVVFVIKLRNLKSWMHVSRIALVI